MGARARVLLAVMVVAASGCSLWLGLEEPRYDDDGDGGATSDAAPDGSPVAPPEDAAEAEGPATDGGTDPFLDPTRWSAFDGPQSPVANGWWSGPFDGRYVYFLRTTAPIALSRYDTNRENDFADPAAWESIALANVAGFVSTFAVSFDGRYVIVANRTSEGGADATVARFDTMGTAAFTSPSSWQVFDASGVTSLAGRFLGAATYKGGTYLSGEGARPFLRHTTSAALDAGWQGYNPSFDAGLGCNRSSLGAACAGNFVYFGPGGASASGDCVMRVDVTKPFDAGATWEAFGLATSYGPSTSGFQGTVSDGQHVYLTQLAGGYGGAAAAIGRVARHDPSAPLTSGWQTRVFANDAGALPYVGGAFDGRFLYFSPAPTAGVATFVRYDSTRPFGDDLAWTFVAGNKVQLANSSHRGAVFDGKYVYFARNTGFTVRFRARDDRAPVASCSPF